MMKKILLPAVMAVTALSSITYSPRADAVEDCLNHTIHILIEIGDVQVWYDTGAFCYSDHKEPIRE